MKLLDMWNHPSCHIMRVNGDNVILMEESSTGCTIYLDRNKKVKIRDSVEVLEDGHEYSFTANGEKYKIEIFELKKVKI